MSTIALEIDRHARSCADKPIHTAGPLRLLNAGFDPGSAAVPSPSGTSFIGRLEAELSKFDSIAIVSPRAFGQSLDRIWDVWRKQGELVSDSWQQISIDVVLLAENLASDMDRKFLRFVVHNPRTGCTKFTTPVSVAISSIPSPVPNPASRQSRHGEIERVRMFVSNVHFGSGISNNVPPVGTMADPIEWYEHGVISRAAAIAKRSEYFARWPKRDYRIIEGTMRITPVGADTFAVQFEYSFEVTRDAMTRAGQATALRTVRKIDGGFLVIAAGERNVRFSR